MLDHVFLSVSDIDHSMAFYTSTYDPRYYAAQVRDLDGYSPEFVYKSWQHGS